jgi:hypothetical protein
LIDETRLIALRASPLPKIDRVKMIQFVFHYG